ncbi:ABC transporter ATP-binding protein [Pararhodobacter marinus]|uniref:ABC transporter ATP-binding protein n=1 Tax=Pararhodobacter marinus TaxID=2184063 RepID=UPI0035198BC6
MLEVQELSVRYGKHIALESVGLRVKPGEIVVILGANGAGKSTLLKAIAGICEGQTSGSVSIDGEPVLGLPAHKVVDRGIALVPEGRGIFGELTVRENLVLGGNPARARDEVQANLDRLTTLFPKLRGRAGQAARTMSGGEQQMVAIGRAMMSNPEILMLDEPSLGLSPLLAKDLFQTLKTVRDAGLGILLVEQNAKLSLSIADRGYLLENGRILREDKAQVLLHDPAVQAAYLGGAAGHATAPKGATKPAAPAPVAERTPVPATPQVRARPVRSVSSGEISGLDIDAIVAGAGRKAVRPVTAAPRNTPPTQAERDAATARRSDSLRAALDAIEEAARKARDPGAARSPLPPLRPTARPAAPPPQGPAPTPQRAPEAPQAQPGGRVEIYRRRPGTSQFQRSEVRDA